MLSDLERVNADLQKENNGLKNVIRGFEALKKKLKAKIAKHKQTIQTLLGEISSLGQVKADLDGELKAVEAKLRQKAEESFAKDALIVELEAQL